MTKSTQFLIRIEPKHRALIEKATKVEKKISFGLHSPCGHKQSSRSDRESEGEEMKRIVGYVRVSTEEQTTGGQSLSAQKGRILSCAEPNDLGLSEFNSV